MGIIAYYGISLIYLILVMPSYLDSLPLLLYEYKVHVIIIFFFYQLDF